MSRRDVRSTAAPFSAMSPAAALAVLSSIFFAWGAITVLDDVLIPHLKAVFALSYREIMLVQSSFFSTYFLMSIPAGRVLARSGYQSSIVIGLIVASAGALLFYPAAGVPSYPLFLLALFVLASGITLLQVAANPYVALLGEPRSASSRLTLAQALNSLGTTLAPWLLGPLILSVPVISATALAQLPPQQQQAYLLLQAHSVQLPYLGIAAALLLLACGVYLLRLPPHAEATEQAGERRHTFAAALAHRSLRLGTVAIFAYVGAEVAIGSFLISYLCEPRIGNLTPEAATRYVAYYWGGAMLGRFLGAALLRRIEPGRLVCAFALAAIALLVSGISTAGAVAMWSVIAIGLFNSIMFPTLFTLGIDGLGPLSSKGSSLLIMAIVGGAVVPELQGWLADNIGVQRAFALPLLCYAYIAWYALRGAPLPAAGRRMLTSTARSSAGEP